MKDKIFVSKDKKTVRICPWECENIEVTFRKTPSGFRMAGKRRIDAQIHDPSECWVPDKVFHRIKRRAASILYPKKNLTLKLPFI